MKDFKTENRQKRVVINEATFKEALKLKEVILKEVKNYPLGLKLMGSKSTIMDREIDFAELLDFIKNVVISADTSEQVEFALYECLKYCTYDNTHKIDRDLFDKIPEAREDYYEIVFACVEENLKPFIKSLTSMWKILAEKLGNNQLLNTILTNAKQ